jgi:hypothetical protein
MVIFGKNSKKNFLNGNIPEKNFKKKIIYISGKNSKKKF